MEREPVPQRWLGRWQADRLIGSDETRGRKEDGREADSVHWRSIGRARAKTSDQYVAVQLMHQTYGLGLIHKFNGYIFYVNENTQAFCHFPSSPAP